MAPRGVEDQKTSLSVDSRVPVTLLCGFLGSGKTTLLKYVLENKHEDENFRCAVIVNDMAELNIDKSLIDSTDLIQTDEAMVGMQNGCICCTLQTDLVEQIIGLVQKNKFNHILIEASGVSEPHEIAPLFEVEDHEDHEHKGEEECEGSGKPQLGEVARIDTCVTVIDSADFYNNLSSMKTYDNCELIDIGDGGDGADCQPIVGTIAELMMDQVEFANVIILNKKDLVNEGQQSDLEEKIKCLNPKAKIVKSIQAKIDLKEILNTGLYKDKDEFWVTSVQQAKADEEKVRKGKRVPEACTARFDIKSFVYRARKPFHPGRLHDLVMEPFFMGSPEAVKEEVDEDEDGEDGDISEEECAMIEEQKEILYHQHQDEANEKQKHRTETMGELLRSKGYMWMATSNDVIGMWQQAGNVLRIETENPWHCLVPEKWEGTPSEDLVLQDFKKPSGEEWEYKDRRQEIVFIGHKMKGDVIQKLLDDSLLTDEEFALGPKKWKETMEHLDTIKLALDDEDEDHDEHSKEKDESKKGAKKRKGEIDSENNPEKKALKRYVGAVEKP